MCEILFNSNFFIENIDFLRKYFDNNAWIAEKSIVKIYKDKFVCKLWLEPAGKESIQCKTWQSSFHFKYKDISSYHQNRYECGRWKCGCTWVTTKNYLKWHEQYKNTFS